VAVFFCFGIVIGRAARSSVESAALAASGAPVRVVVAAPQASAASASTEPPPVEEAQAEPEPAPNAGATAPAAPAGGGATSAPAGPPAATPKPKSSGPKPATKLPAIHHVFVIMLSEEPYAAVFGPESKAHYLVGLESRGALLSRYDAVAHEQLPNEIALVSGQGPTAETAADCPAYSPFVQTGSGADEQALGSGCVYPPSTRTLPQELAAKHLSWRAYVEGIDEAGAPASACEHPALGAADPTAPAAAGAGAPTGSGGAYATFRNPFVYFGSLTGSDACARGDVGLAHLHADLAKAGSTPNFSYIVPGLCHDGSPTPCAAGASAGVAAADPFLRRVVGQITASPAYKHDGLLVITVDEAPSSGEFADSSSCCGQPTYPNLPAAVGPGSRQHGGGAVGALLLSPFIKGPVTSQEPYNHYSLLATIERLFGLKRLGYSALRSVVPLEPSIFTEAGG
jgi:hypothetical protein